MNGLTAGVFLQLLQIVTLLGGGIWAIGEVKQQMAVSIAVIEEQVKTLQEQVGEIKDVLDRKVDRTADKTKNQGWTR